MTVPMGGIPCRYNKPRCGIIFISNSCVTAPGRPPDQCKIIRLLTARGDIITCVWKLDMTKSFWLATIPETPLGAITCAASTHGLAAVLFDSDEYASGVLTIEPEPALATVAELLVSACAQIGTYLRGELKQFDLPLDWQLCTEFQQRVLKETCRIPYGQVRTYGQLANDLGQPKAIRAVGGAVAGNPMPLVVPCHRVISLRGHLRGYSGRGGVQTKAWLLQLEGHLLVA